MRGAERALLLVGSYGSMFATSKPMFEEVFDGNGVNGENLVSLFIRLHTSLVRKKYKMIIGPECGALD